MKLWEKLMEIQKAITNFTNSEKSDKKKSGSKDSEYLFTPGWQISETIRSLMDKHNLMMPISIVSEEHQMVEYPVYKLVDNNVVSFIKKEILSVVTMEYTWVDTENGESAGPYRMIASGANGIDKSTAAAISTAERYVFLKFFHIPCKDAGSELDAHDSSNIPGLLEQPISATDTQIAKQKNRAPIRHVPSVEIQKAQQPTPLSYGKEYDEALNAIAMFARGTQSHTEIVNRELTKLATYGYPVSDSLFVNTMLQIADERRLKFR